MQPQHTTPGYDLFVSYSPADREWVEGYLLDALSAANVRVLSELNFALGAPRIVEFERAIKNSKRTLLVLSPAFMAEAALQFVDLMVQYYGLESGTWPVIPLLLKPVALPPRLDFLVSLDATDPQNWADAIARLCGTLQAAPPAPAAKPLCPYPGMRAFREQETTHFYGREAEVEELVQRLRRHPFVAVIGPSGSGKSSLVNAGLVPALRRSSFFGTGEWLVRIIRPGAQPMAELMTALGKTNFLEFTPAALLATQQDATRLLLVVDQFEEVFTQGSGQKEEFFAAIQRFVSLRDCYAVITVRADFFTDLLTSTLWPSIQAHRLEIAPLGEQGLRAAIVKPAENLGVFVESALVERLVAGSAGQPGLLPFVQEVMVRLWEKLERRYLPLRAYEALVLPLAGYTGSERSGIVAAMAQLADELIYRLNPEEQRLARRIFLRLVHFGEGRADTRRQQRVSELRASGDDAALLDLTLNYLADNRLLVLSGEEGSEARVDLAHEAMLTGWPLLGQWIKKYKAAELTRRSLEVKAAEWIRFGEGEGGLLDWVELQEAEAWLKEANSVAVGCSAGLTALIQESQRRHRHQVRRRKITRVIIYGVLGLVALVLIGAGVNALDQWSLNRNWHSVTGPPSSERIGALAGNQHALVIGSYDYGVAWTKADGVWTGWQRAGLPLGNPVTELNDPQSDVKTIDAIALDDRRPDERYIFVNGRGVFKYNQSDAAWSEISRGLPRFFDACSLFGPCQPLAVSNDAVVYVSDEPGFWMSENGGSTWASLRPDIAASSGTLYAAAFDAQGRLLLGDGDGLIRGSGGPPYAWERIFSGGKVIQITPNRHGGMLLIVEADGAPGILCIDESGVPISVGQPLPVAVPFLAWSGIVPVEVTSVAADLQTDEFFYFATTHGAVYVTDCKHPPARIGQRSWFIEGVGKLTIAEDANQRNLYWATLKRFQRYAIPPG